MYIVDKKKIHNLVCGIADVDCNDWTLAVRHFVPHDRRQPRRLAQLSEGSGSKPNRDDVDPVDNDGELVHIAC